MIVEFSVDLPNGFPGKKYHDYIHKAERKTATFYSLIKDVGVLGLISSSAWGNYKPASLISQENAIRLCCAAY